MLYNSNKSSNVPRKKSDKSHEEVVDVRKESET